VDAFSENSLSLSLFLSLSFFISAMLVGERASWRIGLSRSADVRSSGARKIAEFIDRAVARKICIRARCGRTAVPIAPAFPRVRVCAYIERALSIINTQSYGRLNAGSAPAPGPIIICGIVRVGPISRTAADRGLVSIAVDKIISPSHHLRVAFTFRSLSGCSRHFGAARSPR